MKRIAALLVTIVCMPMYMPHAAAQTGMQKKAEPPKQMPSAPDIRDAPPASTKTPSDPGAVVVPPRTGTEEIVKTPNKAVDPKIDDATEDIDRRNRKRSEQKSAR